MYSLSNTLMMDLFLTNIQLFTSKDWKTGVVWVICGLFRCFYQLFELSFWRHPFNAEDPLVSKWCNTFLQISSDEGTNSSWMAWGWVHFQLIQILGWMIPLSRMFMQLSCNVSELWTRSCQATKVTEIQNKIPKIPWYIFIFLSSQITDLCKEQK